MNRYICIHGHFYQPPRENPWLNEVELQESAHPFHDWNERITDECYARNARSRILDPDGSIVDIMNNYAYMSFNFGPTLLEWMEKKAPETYAAILEADKESMKRFSGHGSALAQSYNHMILPLANTRDKHTQVIWGIEDFRKRFGRDPEGMWLGETAINTDSLEVMAEHGIKFTILSPYQAKRVRRIGDQQWHEASNARVDPRKPYLCNLPSGRQIVLFFYDGPVSQGVAFEKLLTSGEKFAGRLTSTFDPNDREPQLMHIATDGETYGHHHRYGEMALSYALHHMQKEQMAKLTIYGEFLEKHPPIHEAEIIENTSWSCYHGVERWKSNCGCNTGGNNWHQEWRGPLRIAFDRVRDAITPLYEQEMAKLGADPWRVRNAYIQVIMDRSEKHVKRFMKEHCGRELDRHEQVMFLRLLEMQYHAMLMYTSCGWFFDEVTGIETVQDIFYAARAIQLAKSINGLDLEPQFVELLEKAPSNIKEFGNAANAYRAFVRPGILDLIRVGAHYAVSSLFAEDPENLELYSYKATSEEYDLQEAGHQKLAVGKVIIRSKITWSEQRITFAVLHMGDHQLYAGVREFISDEAFETMRHDLSSAFIKGNVSRVLMNLEKHFGEDSSYSFWHLFKDDQRKILTSVLEPTIHNIENRLEREFDSHYPLITAMNELNVSLPTALQMTIEHILNTKLEHQFKASRPRPRTIKNLLDEAKRLNVQLRKEDLEYEAAQQVTKLLQDLENDPDDPNKIVRPLKFLRVLQGSQLQPDYWQAQNIAFRLMPLYQEHLQEGGDPDWQRRIGKLYARLNIKQRTVREAVA
jgi:alpha-amylase/alpha-mannosidase (GH57 family)